MPVTASSSGRSLYDGITHTATAAVSVSALNDDATACVARRRGLTVANDNEKLRYREEHSASVVLSWCTLTFLGRKSVDGMVMANQPLLRRLISHESYQIRRITQNNGHYAFQGHSRSSILVPIESPYATSY